MTNISWICRECAKKLGGTWNDGHVAQLHSNECSVCKEKKFIFSPYDWNLNRDGKPFTATGEIWD